MLIVSFFTPDYDEHAARLRESCLKFRLRHWIEPVNETGKWVHNCAKKAAFVTKALVATSEPVLWLDADAEVKRSLHHLQALPAVCDLAVFSELENAKPVWRFRSGTVLIAPTDRGLALASEWTRRCTEDPNKFDQEHLYHAWEALKDDVTPHWLDMTYCQRFDEKHGVKDPHIVHYQASRTLKAKIGVEASIR